MKRLLLSLLTITSLTLGTTGVAAAFTTWTANISQLPATMNTRSFNVQYTVLSTEADTFTAQLKQSTDGGATYANCGVAQNTSTDPNDVNGGSGALPACVTGDGDYRFEIVIIRDGGEGDSQTVGPTSTHVDATAPGAPVYGGKTQTGNSYVVKFTAPSDSDVTTVKVFASTSKTYTANSATQVGSVAVSPNQSTSFSYTAPDGATRYFSVQAFDAAGNGSSLVGDPGTVVTPVRVVNNGAAASTNGGSAVQTAAATTSTSTGQVQGVSTTNGQVNAPGQSKTNNGKVLGVEATAKGSSNLGWYFLGGVVVILAGAYYWFFMRGKSNEA